MKRMLSVALSASFVGRGFVAVVRKTEGCKWKGSPRNLHKWFANCHQMITSDFQTKIVFKRKMRNKQTNYDYHCYKILYFLKVFQGNKTWNIIWNLFFCIFVVIVGDSGFVIVIFDFFLQVPNLNWIFILVVFVH